MSEITILNLPYPISTNKYWRHYNHHVVLSNEARNYKKMVKLQNLKIKPRKTPLKVIVILHPKLSKRNDTFKKVLDIDNSLKCVLDSLNEVAYEDDAQIKKLNVEYGEAKENGGVTVYISDVK